MGFSAKQVQALRRNLDHRHVRTREANGRELSYIEGWYAISEANRIFGFDGWSRETIESRCVLARENRGDLPRGLYRPGPGHGACRTAQPSFAKATAQVKAAAHRRVRCTISRSKPRKPMPPNAPSPRSGNRSGWRSMGVARSPSPNSAVLQLQSGPIRARTALRLSAGRHDPDSTAIPLLRPPPGSA